MNQDLKYYFSLARSKESQHQNILRDLKYFLKSLEVSNAIIALEDDCDLSTEEALKLDMSIIIEVHTVKEAKRALKYKDALIGINNRNLKTLKTEINTTYDIYDVLKNHSGPIISESGFKNKEELLEISSKTNIKTFLIGESLLKNLEKNSIFSIL